MADKFRGHHIVCTSLYEGKGYSGAFCENMTAVVERLRKDPDEELLLVAEPDMICANCPNRTETNECVHNHNRVVNKDRRDVYKRQLFYQAAGGAGLCAGGGGDILPDL